MHEKSNREFAKELELRTKKFSINILKLGKEIPNNEELNSFRNQLYRSASSIGANYREVNRAKSRSDFRNKIRICEGEAAETLYWMEILNETIGKKPSNLSELLVESKELLALFTRISSKLRVRQT